MKYLISKGADMDFPGQNSLLHAAFTERMTPELFIYLVDVLNISFKANKLNQTPLDFLVSPNSETTRTLLHDWAEKITTDPKFAYVFIRLAYCPDFQGLYKPDHKGKTPMAILYAKNPRFAEYFEEQVLPLSPKLQDEKIKYSQLPPPHSIDSKNKNQTKSLTLIPGFFHHSDKPEDLTMDTPEPTSKSTPTPSNENL